LPVSPRSFRLFDPLPRFRSARPATVGVPRISTPGFTRPVFIAVRPPLSPDDPIDAARLGLRLAALGRVLDDLPRHANRFARWRARLDRDRRSDSAFQEAEGRANPMVRRGQVRRGVTPRTMRIWPLRPGRPAGLRLAGDELRRILGNTHGLALSALRPDTS
jgi:hypothetical protein